MRQLPSSQHFSELAQRQARIDALSLNALMIKPWPGWRSYMDTMAALRRRIKTLTSLETATLELVCYPHSLTDSDSTDSFPSFSSLKKQFSSLSL